MLVVWVDILRIWPTKDIWMGYQFYRHGFEICWKLGREIWEKGFGPAKFRHRQSRNLRQDVVALRRGLA